MQRCTNEQSKRVGQRVVQLIPSRLVVSILCIALVLLLARPAYSQIVLTDSFTGPNLDSSKWTASALFGGCALSFSSGSLVLPGTSESCYVRSNSAFSYQIVHSTIQFSPGVNQFFGWSSQAFGQDTFIFAYSSTIGGAGGNLMAYSRVDGESVETSVGAISFLSAAYHTYTVDRHCAGDPCGTQEIIYKIDGVTVATHTRGLSTEDIYVSWYNAPIANTSMLIDQVNVGSEIPPTATSTPDVLVTPTFSPTPVNAVTEQQAIALIYEEVRDVRLLLLIALPVGLLMLIFAWLRVRQ